MIEHILKKKESEDYTYIDVSFISIDESSKYCLIPEDYRSMSILEIIENELITIAEDYTPNSYYNDIPIDASEWIDNEYRQSYYNVTFISKFFILLDMSIINTEKQFQISVSLNNMNDVFEIFKDTIDISKYHSRRILDLMRRGHIVHITRSYVTMNDLDVIISWRPVLINNDEYNNLNDEMLYGNWLDVINADYNNILHLAPDISCPKCGKILTDKSYGLVRCTKAGCNYARQSKREI